MKSRDIETSVWKNNKMLTGLLHCDEEMLEITSDTWKDEIAVRGYEAFIFDCDGTLVESAEVHFKSFHKAAFEQGQIMDRDWYLSRTGLDRISLFEEFSKEIGALEIDLASRRSIELYIEMSEQVEAIPETKILVEALGLIAPIAVGTNAEKHVAEASLCAAGLLQFFDYIVAIKDGFPSRIKSK